MRPDDHSTPDNPRLTNRRRAAKVAVIALALAGLGVAGMSGALARHSDGWDDDGGFASGSSGGSGWDDDRIFGSGGSGGSGGIDWDDDWDFGSGGSGGSGWDD